MVVLPPLPTDYKSAGAIRKNATIASEVLCVACNTRSAIRSTSSPAQIKICGVPISSRQIVAVNQPLSSRLILLHRWYKNE